MNKILDIICYIFVGIAIIAFIIIVIMFCKWAEHCDITESYYEYIDLDNNKGIARYCSYKFENHYAYGGAGGQGSPICELKDGTVLQVKQYKGHLGKEICEFYK